MQNKHKKSLLNLKLKKFQSEAKFRFTQHHSLNKSPAKNVPSFKTGSQRLLKVRLTSPDRIYDIPEFKTEKSASFGFGTKISFAKKQFVSPNRYNITSSFDMVSMKKVPGPTFGRSQKDFYNGKSMKGGEMIGPGDYNIEFLKKKMTFNMGRKYKQNYETPSPGPGAYNLREQQSFQGKKQMRHTEKVKAPKIRTQYYQKDPLQKYDNKVPGPGAYELSWLAGSLIVEKQKIKKSRLPQCPRFKEPKTRIPGPGDQQIW